MTIVLIAFALYLLATALLTRSVLRDGNQAPARWLIPALAAVAVHAGYHVLVALRTAGGPDMHFFAALSLSGLGMAALTAVFGARAGAWRRWVWWCSRCRRSCWPATTPTATNRARTWAGGWNCMRGWRCWPMPRWVSPRCWRSCCGCRSGPCAGAISTPGCALPPLTELETLLFRTITVGFVLLSLTLLTGLLFVQDFLAQRLLHKTVLSILSWIVFGALLIGRWRNGWRGTKAVHWTLTAMALLVLSFFGSKFVIELVLGPR